MESSQNMSENTKTILNLPISAGLEQEILKKVILDEFGETLWTMYLLFTLQRDTYYEQNSREIEGRFITEDPAKDGFNWYIYCNNNPLTFVDPTGLETYYFGLTASYTIPFVELLNPNIHSQTSASLGFYIDTVDKSFGLYGVNSYGKSVIPDAQAGPELGQSHLEAEDYFSRSTTTAEGAALLSESFVFDVETDELVATETAYTFSALGKFFGKMFGNVFNTNKVAENIFSLDMAGREDYSYYFEFIDFTKDENNDD